MYGAQVFEPLSVQTPAPLHVSAIVSTPIEQVEATHTVAEV
jgi:hypothetical protein